MVQVLLIVGNNVGKVQEKKYPSSLATIKEPALQCPNGSFPSTSKGDSSRIRVSPTFASVPRRVICVQWLAR